MIRPKCECGNLAKKNGVNIDGGVRYYKVCSSCLRRRNKQGTPGARGGKSLNLRNSRLHLYAKYKKDTCECCGFVAVHQCQLDVDHINGDTHNHDPSNLQTLCANCHRLKTQKEKNWIDVSRTFL